MSEDTKKDQNIKEETDVNETTQQTSEETTNDSEQTELDVIQTELDEVKEHNLRLQAEIQNMQRRSRKNREESNKFRAQNLATELISAIDNLERVIDIETSTDEGENIKKGVEMTLNGIIQAFKSQSIELIIPEVGSAFDPTEHEATAMIKPEGDQETGTIAQVLQRGYSLNGRILRPARVAVTE